MFIDRIKIKVRSGNGGNGKVAFRREKFVPEGGPSGGDGGRGAHIIALCDHNLHTLIDFRYKREFKGAAGTHGGIKNMHGAAAADLIIRLPAGTVIIDDADGRILADLTEPGEQVVLARGGKGGRGNARFATPTNRTPELAEKGSPGVERDLRLELRLIAQVGLVGFPNAGKSTLLSAISAAKPKIADYPFTTLQPNLGVIRIDAETSFIVADIPGLIEGASRGLGLGHDFLRHIERTRLLLHIIDCAAVDGRDPALDFQMINRELKLYSEELERRPQVIALNKIDLPQAREVADNLQTLLEAEGYSVFIISALTREGIQPLLRHLAAKLATLPDMPPLIFSEVATEIVTADADELKVKREDDAAWRITAKRVLRLIEVTDFDNEASLKRFLHVMRISGVDDALRQAGVKEGDTVRIADMEFTFSDHV